MAVRHLRPKGPVLDVRRPLGSVSKEGRVKVNTGRSGSFAIKTQTSLKRPGSMAAVQRVLSVAVTR